MQFLATLDINVRSLTLVQDLISNRSKNLVNKFLVSTNYFYYFIGYEGYIPGIKSENVFGETYGKTTYASAK
jgi:hypothetical protein